MPPRKRQRYILGVDLGGTNIVAGAMPEDGSQEIAMRSEPTLADINAAKQQEKAQANASSMAVSSPVANAN